MFWEKTSLEKQIRKLNQELSQKDIEVSKLTAKLEEAMDDVEYISTNHQDLMEKYNIYMSSDDIDKCIMENKIYSFSKK